MTNPINPKNITLSEKTLATSPTSSPIKNNSTVISRSPSSLSENVSETKKSKDERYVPIYRVKLGDRLFDSSKGEILTDKYKPYVWSSTRRHSEARFTLDDPTSEIFRSLKNDQNVEVEIGFANGRTINKFIGQIHEYGRVLPRGTLIIAIDKGFQLNNQVGNSTVLSSDMAIADETRKVQDSADQGQVVSSFTGEASFYGGGDGFDGGKTASGERFNSRDLTAAHKKLPFNTKVKVTNISNNKSVIVRINDRGPYSGNRIIDLSKAAAEAIAMVSSGHAQVKVEVLSSTGSGIATTKNQPATLQTKKRSSEDTSSQFEVPTSGLKTTTAAEMFSLGSTSELKYAKDSDYADFSQGTARLQQSEYKLASTEAALRGDVVIVRGNTVREVSADKVTSTGIILDYKNNPSVFLGYPVITKRSPLQLQSGFGSTTIQGYNITEKQAIAVTGVTPVEVTPVPGGVIQVPEWGSLKMSDPIFPGCVYTWGDVTKGGTRVPNKQQMDAAIRLARAIAPLTEKTVGKGKKWTVNSWFRDPASNAACGGARNSRHLQADAIDFNYPGFMSLWPEMQNSWQGGHAIKAGVFLHLDLGPKRTWRY